MFTHFDRTHERDGHTQRRSNVALVHRTSKTPKTETADKAD